MLSLFLIGALCAHVVRAGDEHSEFLGSVGAPSVFSKTIGLDEEHSDYLASLYPYLWSAKGESGLFELSKERLKRSLNGNAIEEFDDAVSHIAFGLEDSPARLDAFLDVMAHVCATHEICSAPAVASVNAARCSLNEKIYSSIIEHSNDFRRLVFSSRSRSNSQPRLAESDMTRETLDDMVFGKPTEAHKDDEEEMYYDALDVFSDAVYEEKEAVVDACPVVSIKELPMSDVAPKDLKSSSYFSPAVKRFLGKALIATMAGATCYATIGDTTDQMCARSYWCTYTPLSLTTGFYDQAAADSEAFRIGASTYVAGTVYACASAAFDAYISQQRFACSLK